MTKEKFGIANLKTLVVFGVGIGGKVSAALEDKKVTLAEALSLLPELTSLPALVEKKDAIKNEAIDLSLDEVKELIAAANAVSGANLSKDDVIGIIEDSLNLIVSAKNLIVRFTKKDAVSA